MKWRYYFSPRVSGRIIWSSYIENWALSFPVSTALVLRFNILYWLVKKLSYLTFFRVPLNPIDTNIQRNIKFELDSFYGKFITVNYFY